MNAALLSSAKMDWQTPDEVLDLVRQVGTIALDPCTTAENPTGAQYALTPVEDGLSHPWWVYDTVGLVYVNPPYGRSLPAWAEKCAVEGPVCRGGLVMLVPARPDTRWWRRCVDTAQAVAFWRGRLRFKGAPASAPFPSALIYWGGDVSRFLGAFGPRAWVVPA
jgi:phage N-6-adenine-methyltransferase